MVLKSYSRSRRCLAQSVPDFSVEQLEIEIERATRWGEIANKPVEVDVHWIPKRDVIDGSDCWCDNLDEITKARGSYLSGESVKASHVIPKSREEHHLVGAHMVGGRNLKHIAVVLRSELDERWEGAIGGREIGQVVDH